MTVNPAAAIDAANRLTALLDDPAMGGDLLLVGVALVAVVDLHHEALGREGKPAHRSGMPHSDLGTIAHAVVSPRLRGRGRLSDHVVRAAIRDDRRRYESPFPGWGATCQAPMIRRDGYCGNDRGGGYHLLTDWTTGEQTALVYCNRHRDWAEKVRRDNDAEAPDPTAPRRGAPEPYANAGGVLSAHFPEINWPKLWTALSPNWAAPPERTTPPRPRFELLLGDDAPDGDESAAASGLRLIPSGRQT